ncbi:hypothetical protein EVU96_08710 [Bacillus infantis]|uniref:hypothetical protein n=1 Tax=Bacillus infantis TaxID=324767 RepID=UPI00101C02D5|nr:hypothetical protein [Bacillus infantis]RYI30484.1 hypothetical protein EVU96_08710 [Bacillus infantis]
MVKDYIFSIGQEVVIVSNEQDLNKEKGEKATVISLLPVDYINDYVIKLENGEETKVKQREIQAIPEEMLDISTGDKVIYVLANEEVTISKTDFFHGQVEIEFKDGSHVVVGIEAIRKIDKGDEVEVITEENQYAAEKILDLLFKHYKNDKGSYTVPESLLINLINASLKG